MTAQPAIETIRDAVPAPMHVLVIGGGVGGLTLAQGLKKSGVSVAVYERDRSATDRLQGYRVHINPAGSSALPGGTLFRARTYAVISVAVTMSISLDWSLGLT